jgi:hypothetical protein
LTGATQGAEKEKEQEEILHDFKIISCSAVGDL